MFLQMDFDIANMIYYLSFDLHQGEQLIQMDILGHSDSKMLKYNAVYFRLDNLNYSISTFEWQQKTYLY